MNIGHSSSVLAFFVFAVLREILQITRDQLCVDKIILRASIALMMIVNRFPLHQFYMD